MHCSRTSFTNPTISSSLSYPDHIAEQARDSLFESLCIVIDGARQCLRGPRGAQAGRGTEEHAQTAIGSRGKRREWQKASTSTPSRSSRRASSSGHAASSQHDDASGVEVVIAPLTASQTLSLEASWRAAAATPARASRADPSSSSKRTRKSSTAQQTDSIAATRPRRNSVVSATEGTPKSTKQTTSSTTPQKSTRRVGVPPRASLRLPRPHLHLLLRAKSANRPAHRLGNRPKMSWSRRCRKSSTSSESERPTTATPSRNSRRRARNAPDELRLAPNPRRTRPSHPRPHPPGHPRQSAAQPQRHLQRPRPKARHTRQTRQRQREPFLRERRRPLPQRENGQGSASSRREECQQAAIALCQHQTKIRIKAVRRYFAGSTGKQAKTNVGPSDMPVEDPTTGFLAFADDDSDDASSPQEDAATRQAESQSDDSSDDEAGQADAQAGSVPNVRRRKPEPNQSPARSNKPQRRRAAHADESDVELIDVETEPPPPLTRDALLDAVPYSHFEAVLDGQTPNTIVKENKKRSKEALYFGLRHDETLSLLGIGCVRVLRGCVQIGGAVLSTSTGGFQSAKVHAPICHALPVLRCVPPRAFQDTRHPPQMHLKKRTPMTTRRLLSLLSLSTPSLSSRR